MHTDIHEYVTYIHTAYTHICIHTYVRTDISDGGGGEGWGGSVTKSDIAEHTGNGKKKRAKRNGNKQEGEARRKGGMRPQRPGSGGERKQARPNRKPKHFVIARAYSSEAKNNPGEGLALCSGQ